MFTFNNAKICGISACVPNNIEKNILTSKEKSYLGVSKRYFDKKGFINTSDLCMESAKKILKSLHWKVSEIKFLLFVSQTRDFIFPSTACILQNKLGLKNDIIAYDIPLGCSGFIYGLFNSFSLAEKTKGKGLLLVGDMSSKFIDKNDKQNIMLFGDAGSAVAIDFTKKKTNSFFSFGTDGSGSDYIKYTSDQFKKFSNSSFTMKGGNVFHYMVKKIPSEIIDLEKKSNSKIKQIDFFVFHQASKFLIEKISEKLNIDRNKVLLSLKDFGNTNSASIPITLLNSRKKIKKNSKLIFSGFGVGLSWGNVILDIKDIKFTKLYKI